MPNVLVQSRTIEPAKNRKRNYADFSLCKCIFITSVLPIYHLLLMTQYFIMPSLNE